MKSERESLGAEPIRILRAAGEILRAESEKDESRSKNDQAELRIAAAVCEGVAANSSSEPSLVDEFLSFPGWKRAWLYFTGRDRMWLDA